MGFTSILRLAIRTFFGKTKEELVRVIDVLRKKYLTLRSAYEELSEENIKLKAENDRLKEEIEKEKIKKVNRTSNKPSSKKADWELGGVGNDGKGKKKKGRVQKKRKGSGSKPKNKTITRKEKSILEKCYKCGKDLSNTVVLNNSNIRIIEDIPQAPVALQVIQVEQEKKYCDNCKEVITASTGLAVKGMNVGMNTTIQVIYFWIYTCLSFSRISTLLSDFYSLKISTSGLSKHVQKIGLLLKPVYEEILKGVKESEIIHADETGWKVNGKKWWLWVVGNKNAAYYTIDKSRGKDVVRKMLGEVFLGVLVVDGWKAYLSLECEQQSCMAHLLRKIRNLHHAFPRLRSVFSFYILFRKILRDGEKLQSQKEELQPKIFKRRLAKLHHRLEELLKWKNPNDLLKTIIKKVRNQQGRILTFVEHPDVPCHNNFGEYLIRIGVLKRKISFGSKSAKGAEAYAILLSIYTTCKLRNIHFLKFLRASLTHLSQFRKPLLLSEYIDQQNAINKAA